MNLNQLAQEIRNEIDAAESHMAEIDKAQQELEAAGMYPAIPRIEWQARNGEDANYMYLVFSQNRDGSYPSPNGKRKIYIGASTKKQGHAAKMIDRRQRWERLDAKANNLNRWIGRKEAELKAIKHQLETLHRDRQTWQQFTIEEKDKAA